MAPLVSRASLQPKLKNSTRIPIELSAQPRGMDQVHCPIPEVALLE
jgi:hypothetical protein